MCMQVPTKGAWQAGRKRRLPAVLTILVPALPPERHGARAAADGGPAAPGKGAQPALSGCCGVALSGLAIVWCGKWLLPACTNRRVGGCSPLRRCPHPPPQAYPITDVRGRGLMLAAEFGGANGGLAARPHTAADITHAAARRGMLLMGAGKRRGCKCGEGCSQAALPREPRPCWLPLCPPPQVLPPPLPTCSSHVPLLPPTLPCRGARDHPLPAAPDRQRGRGGGGAVHLRAVSGRCV